MSVNLPVVAVTGAAGFTGGAVVRRLLEKGHGVRGLVRAGQRSGVSAANLTLITGHLGNREALAELVAGTDVVIHVAAMFRTEGPPERFFQVNHQGTQNVLAAARAGGTRRLVHCSTIGVHGHVELGPADEQSPFNPRDAYQASKLKAEEACRDAMQASGMEIVIVRPCSIYGPGDLRMLKLFRMLRRGTFLMIGDGSANFHPVYIDDLVTAFLAAASLPQAAGETFIIGGPRYLPLSEYIRLAAFAAGARPPRLRIPYRLMEMAAQACEGICRPIGIEPPLHRRRLSFFKHNRAFRIEKARKVLGYEPRIEVTEGLKRTVEWYRGERLL